MKRVGFCGGSLFFELGSASDKPNFFSYLNKLSRTERDRYLLERIYCKYIKFDEIDESCALLNELKNLCSEDFIYKFSKYFESIKWCSESAKEFYEDWNIYQEIKIIITEMPYCISEMERSKEEYDALTLSDVPFWLR